MIDGHCVQQLSRDVQALFRGYCYNALKTCSSCSGVSETEHIARNTPAWRAIKWSKTTDSLILMDNNESTKNYKNLYRLSVQSAQVMTYLPDLINFVQNEISLLPSASLIFRRIMCIWFAFDCFWLNLGHSSFQLYMICLDIYTIILTFCY